jgi:hypothetical protein
MPELDFESIISLKLPQHSYYISQPTPEGVIFSRHEEMVESVTMHGSDDL